jgi:DNA-binding MarR family transcriptional regulator
MPSKAHRVAVESTPLVDTISYLLWRLQSELAHAWQRQGEHEQIRHRAAFDILLLLGIYPGLSQSDLSRALVKDKSNTATLVRNLQERHWVARRAAPDDARRFGLYLTPAGVHQLAQMRRAHQRHEETMVAALGIEQASALIELLHRAVAAAQSIVRR